jgi:hypothetical protein
MNSMDPVAHRRNLFRVRPAFLLACAGFLVAIILPDALRGKPTVQRVFLLLASLVIASGWFLLLKYREPNSTWRKLVALVTSVYLTLSIPAFFFELSPVRWFLNPVISMYEWPWAHWGRLLIYFGVAGSLLGRGRARIAFVVGSILLLILRASFRGWIF